MEDALGEVEDVMDDVEDAEDGEGVEDAEDGRDGGVFLAGCPCLLLSRPSMTRVIRLASVVRLPSSWEGRIRVRSIRIMTVTVMVML